MRHNSPFVLSQLMRSLRNAPPAKEAQRDAACRTLRLTHGQYSDILAAASERALVDDAGSHYELTDAGAAVATLGLDDGGVASRGQERYRPFTDYIPRRWYPDQSEPEG